MRFPFFPLVLMVAAAGSLTAQDLPLRPTRSLPANSSASPNLQPQTPPPFSLKDQGSAIPLADGLIRFNPDTIEIRWVDKHWQVLAGGIRLKDFGPREGDAREAVRIIRELGLNQHGTIGTPRPVMEYWLKDGRAPDGFVPSPRRVPVDLNTLRVEEMQGQWCLRDAYRFFFTFGRHQGEANQALETMRRYGFTQVGFVGQPGLGMTYFLGGQGFGSGRMAVQPAIVSRRKSHESAQEQQPPSQANQIVPVTLPNGQKLAAVNPLAAAQPLRGDRVCFDPHHLEIKHDNQGWKLCSGDYTIAQFGASQAAARQAENALQFYRCNEHCLIGDSGPIFSFFLANGQPPRGMMFGLRGIAFRPGELTLRQEEATWTLFDREQPLIRLGNNLEDAHALLRIIQGQHFDHLCHIGPPPPQGLNLLVRTR